MYITLKKVKGTTLNKMYVFHGCYGLNICVSLKFMYGYSNFQGDGIRGWAFGGQLSYDGRSLVHGISAFTKEAP